MFKNINTEFFGPYESYIKEIPAEYEDDVKEKYVRDSFKRLIISNVLFLCIIIISLLRDYLTGFYARPEEPYNFLHLIAFVIMIISSFIVIGFGIADMRKPVAVNVLVKLHSMFYISINLALGLFMFNEFYRGYYTTYEQFYWLFFAFVPLMHFRSNLINMIFSFSLYLLEYITVMIIQDVSFIHFLYIVPILITMELFGLYLRQYYLKNTIYDIQNQILQKQLKNQSIIDPLTGCYNRYAMQEQFTSICAEEEKISLFMFDIDKFKLYNDTFSHIEGDECLNQISTAIISICKLKQMNLYRYGGEEFVIISKAMEESEIKKFATELLKAVRNLKISTPALNEFGNIVTISVGAETISSGLSLKDGISLVDKQMYMAKNNGRNCAFYKNEKIDESST